MCNTPLSNFASTVAGSGSNGSGSSTERAVAELHHVPALILVLLVALGLFLTADGEHPIGERYVQILLIDARQLCGYFDRILALGNVDLRRQQSELNRNGVRCEKSSNVFRTSRNSDPNGSSPRPKNEGRYSRHGDLLQLGYGIGSSGCHNMDFDAWGRVVTAGCELILDRNCRN